MQRIWFHGLRGNVVVILLSLALTALAAPPSALERARKLADARHYDQAIAVLDRRLAEQVDDLEAGLLRGVLLTRLGRTVDAIAAFNTLARLHPELPEPHNNLAVLYATQHHYELARVALLRALELRPRYETAYENLGDIYVQLAVAAYDRAAKLDPANTAIRDKARRLDSLAAPPRASAVASSAIETPATGAAPPRAAKASAAAAPDPVAPAPPSASGAASPATACYTFDGFTSAEQARRAAQRLSAPTVVKAHARQVLLNFKVYLPPLANRRAADTQIRRMQSAGIRDLIRIPRGDLTNGIALGVYGSEGAARRRVSELGQAGYEARFEPRYATRSGFRIEARYPASGRPEGDAIEGFPGTAEPCD